MYIKVKVDPGARRERVVRISDTTFEMAVKAPAERNLANERVRELLAEAFLVPVRSVRLVTGHRSGSKIYDVGL